MNSLPLRTAHLFLKEYRHAKDHLYVKQRASGVADYARGIRSLVRGFWKSFLDESTFIDTMVFAIQRGLTRAWAEGAAQCGVGAAELTDKELRARDRLIASQYTYLVGFSNDIAKNQQEKKGKLTPLMRRADLWVGRYTEAYYAGMQMACKDQKLMWVWNPLKEHCGDCAVLNGLVFRASTWSDYNLRPRSRDLECKGYKCGCSFKKTDAPLTDGVPPVRL